jgi:hypothetical protein
MDLAQFVDQFGPPSLSSLAQMPDYGDSALNSSESFVHCHRNSNFSGTSSLGVGEGAV